MFQLNMVSTCSYSQSYWDKMSSKATPLNGFFINKKTPLSEDNRKQMNIFDAKFKELLVSRYQWNNIAIKGNNIQNKAMPKTNLFNNQIILNRLKIINQKDTADKNDGFNIGLQHMQQVVQKKQMSVRKQSKCQRNNKDLSSYRNSIKPKSFSSIINTPRTQRYIKFSTYKDKKRNQSKIILANIQKYTEMLGIKKDVVPGVQTMDLPQRHKKYSLSCKKTQPKESNQESHSRQSQYIKMQSMIQPELQVSRGIKEEKDCKIYHRRYKTQRIVVNYLN